MKEISILEELKLFLEAEEVEAEEVEASVDIPTSPRLKLDVNPNPTKKGVKVQFILPKGYSANQKEELTQKLKTKLNAGLAPHMMSVDVDLDVPYENVIGFLIRLSNIKMLIKSILEGGSPEEPAE
jgi:biopolymer transport protein ExbD